MPGDNEDVNINGYEDEDIYDILARDCMRWEHWQDMMKNDYL